jgi:predicted nucleic acid-binding protein
LLLDTSAAIALVLPDHEHHDVVRQEVRNRRIGLSGHAELETYSVLTRLPAPRRLSAAAARRLVRTNFPETRHLPVARRTDLLDELAAHGIAGGAVYDALVAATARHHDLTLLSVDAQAGRTYRLLGVLARVLG